MKSITAEVMSPRQLSVIQEEYEIDTPAVLSSMLEKKNSIKCNSSQQAASSSSNG
jgi:hypothetical protein